MRRTDHLQFAQSREDLMTGYPLEVRQYVCLLVNELKVPLGLKAFGIIQVREPAQVLFAVNFLANIYDPGHIPAPVFVRVDGRSFDKRFWHLDFTTQVATQSQSKAEPDVQ